VRIIFLVYRDKMIRGCMDITTNANFHDKLKPTPKLTMIALAVWTRSEIRSPTSALTCKSQLVTEETYQRDARVVSERYQGDTRVISERCKGNIKNISVK